MAGAVPTERQAVVSHSDATDVTTSPNNEAEALKALVRRNTEQVQGQGDCPVRRTVRRRLRRPHPPARHRPNKAGVRVLYNRLRDAFLTSGPSSIGRPSTVTSSPPSRSTTGRTAASFSASLPPQDHPVQTVDAMRVRDWQITDHWGVANLYFVLQQLGQLPPT